MSGQKTLVALGLAVLFAGAAFAAEEEKWVDLFDGKTTQGWRNPYKWGEAKVVDGEIHLTSNKGKWFLCTEKQYADFIFEGEVKVPEGNSGFMFRCHVAKNKVFGYQAEVDPSARKWSGGLYDEGRRKWFISPNRDGTKDKAKKAESIAAFRKRAGESFKREEWNKFRIECRGKSIKIYVNDTLCTDVEDDMDAQGYIGIQHHGEKNKVYKFRNLRIQILKEADQSVKPSEKP